MLNTPIQTAVELKLGYRFTQPGLLQQALTHRSFSSEHNERLEFLGDAVLGLCIAQQLMQQLPQATEGQLSRSRANLVREETLYRIALQLNLPAALRLGEGEQKAGGRSRASILADTFEAIIAAVYLDGGFAAAQQCVNSLFAHIDLASTAQVSAKDVKTRLQEWLQSRRMALPVYQIEQIHGAAHAQVFEVCCRIAALPQTTKGQGVSRKAAEQQAAAHMLEQLAKSNQGE